MQSDLRSRPAAERISVAMCTYNGARFLPQQLESILGQTELPNELVICDDGSTDATLTLLEQFAQTAPFPTLIYRNEERLRFSQNFAKCISLCSGEIIVMTDQDDMWVEHRVEETRRAFEESDALTFTFSDAPLIDESGQDLHRTIYSNVPVFPADRGALTRGTTLLPVIMRWGLIYGCTMAFRSRYLPIILPIPKIWSHDEWISMVLSALGPSARLPPVTRYRQHSIQLAGAGALTLQARLNRAQQMGGEQYQTELRYYETALSAVETRPELQQRLLPLLRAKISFLRTRINVQNGGLREIKSLFRLLRARDYSRFGSGLRSALKDLALVAGIFTESTRK